MVMQLSGLAGQLMGGRKQFRDFEQERADFMRRKEDREMRRKLSKIQIEQAERQLRTPSLPFEGTSFDAQIANEAYKFNLSKGMDDLAARQTAVDMVMGSKVDYRMVDDGYGNKTLQTLPRSAVFGSQENENSQPDMMVAQAQPTPQAPYSPQQIAEMMPSGSGSSIPPIPASQLGETMQPHMNIDSRALASPEVQMDLAKELNKGAIDQQLKIDEESRSAALKAGESFATTIGKAEGEEQSKLKAVERMKSNMQEYKSLMADLPQNMLDVFATKGQKLAGLSTEMTQATARVESLAPALLSDLKQLVRQPGEGTFTDADQRAIEGMSISQNDPLGDKVAKYQTMMEILGRYEKSFGGLGVMGGLLEGSPSTKSIPNIVRELSDEQLEAIVNGSN